LDTTNPGITGLENSGSHAIPTVHLRSCCSHSTIVMIYSQLFVENRDSGLPYLYSTLFLRGPVGILPWRLARKN